MDVCPVCKTPSNVGEVISCDICDQWLHTACAGVSATDYSTHEEDSSFSCPQCTETGRNRTVSSSLIPAVPVSQPMAEDQSQPGPNTGRVRQGGGRTRQTEEGDRVDLTPFLDPPIPRPVPGPGTRDKDGWAHIDGWGAWDCASACIVPLEDVPRAYRKPFSTAFSTVLRHIEQADTEVEVTRGLKWFLALPKLLLREPKSRGAGGARDQGRFLLDSRRYEREIGAVSLSS